MTLAQRRSVAARTVPGVPWWELLWTLTERQIRLRAKRSWFGKLWPAVAPWLLLGLYAFVFGSIFNVPIKDYSVYLCTGLLPWSFLAQSVGGGVASLAGEQAIVRRAPFRYELVPLASMAVFLVAFVADLVVLLVYLAIRGQLAWALLPALLLPTLALVFLVGALVLVLSLIDVYNRDLRQVIGNLLTVWFFLVPITYRQQMVPSQLVGLRSVDPMNMVVGSFRQILYFGHITLPSHLIIMMVVCGGMFVGAIAVFRRVAPMLPKDV